MSAMSDEHDEIERMKRDLEVALAEEADAADRAASLMQELEDRGVDTRRYERPEDSTETRWTNDQGIAPDMRRTT